MDYVPKKIFAVTKIYSFFRCKRIIENDRIKPSIKLEDYTESRDEIYKKAGFSHTKSTTNLNTHLPMVKNLQGSGGQSVDEEEERGNIHQQIIQKKGIILKNDKKNTGLLGSKQQEIHLIKVSSKIDKFITRQRTSFARNLILLQAMKRNCRQMHKLNKSMQIC